MDILVVDHRESVSSAWKLQIEALGHRVFCALAPAIACDMLNTTDFDVIVINLDTTAGAPLCVAECAEVRQPSASLVFISGSGVFSDGSIFGMFRNARAFLPGATDARDLACMVDHFAAA